GRVAGQHQERRLEGVLGEVGVADRPPAHPQHHHPVPPDQRRERGLVPLGGEPAEQGAVVLAGEHAGQSQRQADAGGHRDIPRGRHPPYHVRPRREVLSHFGFLAPPARRAGMILSQLVTPPRKTPMRAVHFLVTAVLAATAVLLAPGAAAAHDLLAVVKVRDADVYVEAGYAYGKDAEPAEGAAVTVTDADGNRVAAGATDERGVWTFPRPAAGAYTVVVEQAGHRAAVTLAVPETGTAEFLPSRLDKRHGLAIGLALVLGFTLVY